jgi:hypothetical protein
MHTKIIIILICVVLVGILLCVSMQKENFPPKFNKINSVQYENKNLNLLKYVFPWDHEQPINRELYKKNLFALNFFGK